MTPPARTPAVFGREHVPLLTAAEAERLDTTAQEDGFPGRALMENAGRAAAAVLHRLHPTGRVVAAVGGGNNGGDALVVCRTLRAWGRDVAWVPATGTEPDPRLLADFDVPRLEPSEAVSAFAMAGVLVDGILGTGGHGAPREPAAGLIRAMNGSGRPIVALDIPTGVDPTTGQVPGDAVTATATIMFGWPKTGALFHPGRGRCGRLVAVEIG
ncbi:MAG TPA: NAD(P)H-hydrate epimerase, partial [Longimicrobiales bacterium]|nr:NAD(P)H-hydrate epimerase [Longimicrobiales bacterium]